MKTKKTSTTVSIKLEFFKRGIRRDSDERLDCKREVIRNTTIVSQLAIPKYFTRYVYANFPIVPPLVIGDSKSAHSEIHSLNEKSMHYHRT